MKKVVPAGGDRHRAPVETPLVTKQRILYHFGFDWDCGNRNLEIFFAFFKLTKIVTLLKLGK